jgi:hypothetical protein
MKMGSVFGLITDEIHSHTYVGTVHVGAIEKSA